MNNIRSAMRLLVSVLLVAAAFVSGFSTTLAKHIPTISVTKSPRPALVSIVSIRTAANPTPTWRDLVEKRGGHPNSESQYDEILKTLLQWALTDPKAALDYVRNHYDPRHRNAFLSAILAQWAQKDGGAALDWVGSNLSHDYTQYDAMLCAIGKTDALAAWNAAQQLAALEDKVAAQGIYVSALRGIIYNGDYVQAAQLIENLQMPGGGEKYDLSSVLAGQWGIYEPAKAAAWAVALPNDNDLYRQQAIVSLGVSWAQSDPEAAANFALQLPAGVTRQNVLTTALDSWATDNPNAAATWLNESAPDPDLDMVVRSLATSPKWMNTNPEIAIAWADTIFNDGIRQQAINIIMDRWKTKDPLAAQQFLNRTEIEAGNNETSSQ